MIAIDIERAAGVLAAASLKGFLLLAVAGLVVTMWASFTLTVR